MDGELDELRQTLRRGRRELADDERGAADAAIVAALLDLPELAGPGRLATYAPTDGEVDLSGAMPELGRRSWALHLPAIGVGRGMAFARWDEDEDLVPNRYGVPEPIHTDDRGGRVGAAELDVVIVPCVGVDASGNRVGFGAGYYDRALAEVGSGEGRPTLVGVVYELQVVAELPARPWDVPLDVIVTERRVLRP